MQPSDAAAPSASSPIRVFLAEDHAITLWGLRRLLDGSAQMQVVGTASSCAELEAHAAAADAEVILLDLNLGGEDSTRLLAGLRQRCRARVLVLTGSDSPEAHREAVVQGARGVVHKSEPAEVILRAIRKVHEGEIWLHRSMLGEVLGALTSGAQARTEAKPADPNVQRIGSLTPRERQIVEALLRSAGAKLLSVADGLRMSENTLRNHLTTIYGKLGVRGRLELHVYATAHGLGT